MEKDSRYLLAGPDEDHAALVFDFLRHNIPTPTLPDWKDEVFNALKENSYKWGRYATEPHHHAQAQAIPASIGNLTAWKVTATEETFDALVTRLIQAGQISF